MPPSEWWNNMPWFGMLMMPLMMVIFLVVFLLVIIPLLRSMGMGPPWRARAVSALEKRDRYPQ